MRIVFPTNENGGLLSKRGAHFGRAHYYTVIDIEDGRITDVSGIANPGHAEGGCGSAVSNITALGADALIVGGIGGSPLKGFIQAGVAVYHDDRSARVQESVDAYLSGALSPMTPEMSCSH
jgi:predicted Fe-Mo cluster-binding NifX family protein